MADKMSKLVLPVKSGNEIINKEFDISGSENRFVGTTAEWNALTAEQQNAYDCRVLTDDDLDIKNVIDNLTSNSSTDALSAKQGKVLKGLIDSISESDYFCGYTLAGEKTINFIDTASGKTMFNLWGVLTLKDNILTFNGYKITKTSDFPSNGRVLAYVADITSTFTELSNYEWDTDWIAENFSKYMDPDAYDKVIGWCEIFSEPVYTQMEYVSGNGLKIRLTHHGTFSGTGNIKVDFLHLSAKIKPRTT